MAVASDLPEPQPRPSSCATRATRSSTTSAATKLGILTGNENRILSRTRTSRRSMRSPSSRSRTSASTTTRGVDLRGIARAFVAGPRPEAPAQGGSTITQQFVKNALAGAGQPHGLREAARGGARLPPHEEVVQGEHPHQVPQHDLLRQRRLRDRVGGAHVLRQGPATTSGCGDSVNRPCAKELQPWEAALLAGIIASPSAYDPRRPPGRREAPPRHRAGDMLEQGRLTRAEYEDALVSSRCGPASSTRRGSARARPTSRPGCASS